ncbi:MAG: tetratricopeptide repeat protein [Thiohalomonadales bacterium]|nr:tetratricopeptide repeat protein [Thiohalomonadales bacterium]
MKGLVLAMVVVLMAGCASHPADNEGKEAPLSPEQQFKTGESLRLSGNYADALASYVPLTKRDDEWGLKAKLAIARMALDDGKNAEAERAYQVILEDNPTCLDAQEGLGLTKLAQGDWKAARRQLQIVNRQDSGRWRTLNGLGIVADMTGAHDAAARWYGLALDAGGERPLVINNAGYSLIMAGHYHDAEQLLAQAVRRYPTESRLRHNLAISQARQRHYDQAIRTWQVGTGKADAISNAGYIALVNGDLDKAKALLEQAKSISTRYMPRTEANLEAVKAALAERQSGH